MKVLFLFKWLLVIFKGVIQFIKAYLYLCPALDLFQCFISNIPLHWCFRQNITLVLQLKMTTLCTFIIWGTKMWRYLWMPNQSAPGLLTSASSKLRGKIIMCISPKSNSSCFPSSWEKSSRKGCVRTADQEFSVPGSTPPEINGNSSCF